MNKIPAWIHDILVLTGGFVFTTGILPFAPQSFYLFADQQPAVHRAAVTAAALFASALLLIFRRTETPLKKILEKIHLPGAAWLWILFAVTGTVWTYASIERFQSFNAGFDMAIFSQAVWNTVHGNFLYSSIKGGICLLGDHFGPLLAVFALPYALWPKPECLLALQAFAAASAVFPLFRLVRNKTGNAGWALACAFALTLYLPLRNSVRFEFHPEVAAMPLLLWSCCFLEEGKAKTASFFLFLALLSKESFAAASFGMGIYGLFKKKPAFGIFWTAFSVLYLYTVTSWIIPRLSGQEYQYLSGNFMTWKEQGAGALLKHLAGKESFLYLIKIFLPAGFLTFLHPSAVLTFPGLLQNLTARNESTLSIFYQYTAGLTPFVFFSSALTLARFYPDRRLLGFFLLCSVLMAGVPDFYIAWQFRDQKNAHTARVERTLASIPPGASLRTHEFFAAHASGRKELFIFENTHPREGGSPKAQAADYVVVDVRRLGGNSGLLLKPLWAEYKVLSEEQGLMVFKRKT